MSAPPDYNAEEPWQVQRFRSMLRGTDRLARRSRPVHLAFRLVLLLLVVGFFAVLLVNIVTGL